jgi:hypothetical protein
VRLRIGSRTPACARDGLTARQARRGSRERDSRKHPGMPACRATCATWKEDNIPTSATVDCAGFSDTYAIVEDRSAAAWPRWLPAWARDSD